MSKQQNKIELLSPAGNIEKMQAALAHGADAVYAGIPDFSLRVRINDFDLEKLKKATEYCHRLGKKMYVTVNIFAHNHHLKKLPKYIQKLKQIKVDALIISDPGVISLVQEVWPEAEIHLSTQANCTNWRAAQFWHEQGVKRIILGRETTLEEIKEIHKKVPQIELEYFVHGAMCMSYSGRCFLSKLFVGRSGNLGDCVQPCRWRYFITEEKRPDEPLELVEEAHGSYILNSKDLNLLEYLDKLKKAGVVSLKIEGRAKSVYYQAMVAGIYSRALQDANQKEIKFLYKELENKITHRGYTTGFLLGEKADQELENTHQKIDWEFCGVVKKQEKNKVYIKVHNTIKVKDEIEIIQPFYDIINMRVDKMLDSSTEKAIEEAHGGAGGKTVILEINKKITELSVLRRKLN